MYTRCSEMHVWITSPSREPWFIFIAEIYIHIYWLFSLFILLWKASIWYAVLTGKLFCTQDIKSTYSTWPMFSFLNTRCLPVSLHQRGFIENVFLYYLHFWGCSWEISLSEFKINLLEKNSEWINSFLSLSHWSQSILSKRATSCY